MSFHISPCPLKIALNQVKIKLQRWFTPFKNHETKGEKIEHDLDGCEQPKGLKNGSKVGRQRLLAALVDIDITLNLYLLK